jgi:hypothetical protein
MLRMNIIDRLNQMIEEAEDLGNYKFANALSNLQIEIIKERSREWDKGYAIGYDLGLRESELKKLRDKSIVTV